MKALSLTVALSLLVIFANTAEGATTDDKQLHFQRGNSRALYGQVVGTAKALGDTIYLLGNPRDPDQVSDGGVGPQANGTFEDEFGVPGWFGWTHEDYAFYDSEIYWHVSDFNVVSGNYSMWCGTYYGGDPGYGNGWLQRLIYSYQVADNSVASTVNLKVTVQNDTEPEYDYTYVEYNADGIWHIWNPGGYDGNRTYYFDESVVYQPGDYVGSSSDEIQLRIRFNSDGAWSDEDGLWDTNGACQVDDIEVRVDGVLVESEDFEDGPDGTYNWIPVPAPGVGDFAALYFGLQELDPCHANTSIHVAFIDDGVVVPGTGGSHCTTWCYGPGGYIVNNTGGLMGPDFHVSNAIISPPLEWPAGLEGASIGFDVYIHELLIPYSPWPGVVVYWSVRSVASGNEVDLENAPWNGWHDGWIGGPEWEPLNRPVSDLLVPGCTHVQLGLRIHEWGNEYTGTDGTPAPYFDNAKFVAYPITGPTITAFSNNLFNDNFPEAGELDFADLSNNNVRLDMAENVASQSDLVNYPGDSIWCDIAAVRAGFVLDDMPKMHVRMRANPLFDDVRVLPPNFVQTGNVVEGWVYGDSTYWASGNLVPDRYNFDLPDDDFFFPGDVLKYYIEARDNLAGDIGITLLPGDTAGFHNLEANLQYPAQFTVRALPTMFSATADDQPRIIFWQDSDYNGEGRNHWFLALNQLGYRMGVDYDMYFTHVPQQGLGNGLGGRATSVLLDGYDTLLYTSGRQWSYTLSNGDFGGDPSNDIQVISNWFANGDKNAFMTGDNLVEDLLNAGASGQAFVITYFNVNYVDNSIQNLIGNQITPTVAAINGNGVIVRVPEWKCNAGCPLFRDIDAIEANAGTIRLAEFTDPGGSPGFYNYAAASYHINATENARVVLMPYAFMANGNTPDWTPPAGYAGISARAIILEDILFGFGEFGSSDPVGVTPAAVLSVTSFPNPFNPATTIKLTLPRTGDVSLKVFNVRGELVRTLVDGRLEAGMHDIVWDGKADQGNQVASGVYFYEMKAGGEVRVNKMALVR